jgi:hypothetical protein
MRHGSRPYRWLLASRDAHAFSWRTMISPSDATTEGGGDAEGLTPAALLAAGPVLALLEQGRSELSVIRRRSPGSDSVVTLANCLEELREAIRAGRDTRQHLTIAEAHAASRIPVSTLRWLCKQKPQMIGARKHEGVWYIERTRFERYQSLSDDAVRAKRGEAA